MYTTPLSSVKSAKCQTRVIEAYPKGSGGALKALDMLFEKPVIMVRTLSEGLGTSYGGANGIVSRFEDLGILRRTVERSRHRVYSFDAYLDLLAK